MAIAHSNASTTNTTSTRRGRPPRNASAKTETIQPPNCINRLEPNTRRVVARAIKALEDSAVYRTEAMNTPGAVRLYLKLKMASLDHEEFHVIWLDAQNRVISFDAMFSGSLTQTSVYPREVVKAALAHNAAACILAHNHPSGLAEPSRADMELTKTLKNTLAMIDVRVLDHFIVAGNLSPLSFTERGLL